MNKRELKFTIFTFLAIAVLVYLVSVGFRAYGIYSTIKKGERGWTGHTFGYDRELGYAPNSGAKGYELLPGGQRIPVIIDPYGFRTSSETEPGDKEGKSILFLGGSFTFGAAVSAEQTFASIVSRQLGLEGMNAGVPSYGLAHMVVRAKRAITKHEPDFVVAQYSPWLVKRAMKPVAVSSPRFVPAPYFTEKRQPEIQKSIIPAKWNKGNFDEFRSDKKGVIDFIEFFLDSGVSVVVQNDLNRIFLYASMALGIMPDPSNDSGSVIQESYNRIKEVTERNGGKFLILILGSNRPFTVPGSAFPDNVPVVNAHAAMVRRLPQQTPGEYARHYFHWRGNPPRLIDNHPNIEAHRIIADQVISGIQKN